MKDINSINLYFGCETSLSMDDNALDTFPYLKGLVLVYTHMPDNENSYKSVIRDPQVGHRRCYLGSLKNKRLWKKLCKI